MKKLVLMLAVAFSVSLFSCGGSDADKTVDSDSIKAAEQAVKDSTDKANAEAQAAAEAAAAAADEAANAEEGAEAPAAENK